MTVEKVDFKKTQKEFYQAKTSPTIIDVPEMPFIMVNGKGDPNTSATYKQALDLLYALSYTIKMSPKQNDAPDGYFDYVVAPLEGLWWLPNDASPFSGHLDKDQFNWTAMIRQPDFVTVAVFEHFREIVQEKKPTLDVSLARLEMLSEGLCGQIMHIGSYDDEPATIKTLDDFIVASGHRVDISATRRHHEIYLSDPRRVAPEKLKTVIRHPIQ
ncbi:hypothetical protein RR45_GL002104 [Lactococcus chungangensis CAU 28 = DSM 22330]|jgi:Uncharacterized conserved protein|uniref:GyrI-like small molecule binding domain-containing protein n=1 Tax=Pseudolactococcus chungangensis CAU 28 = DSM 22330 TaxID=1122154 RepID=A0A1K2HES7_9LACT|nr:GyrI-like domain-containing protein [Lactococcus chungangensis]NCB82474.1 transcriptional regulator [Bacilli bacterium]PCS03335.1 hypothetical protein RR45_GL002104 [Lactococcus chungangensis CAU 28 = DSM 22330]SFZ75255.1 hypothetical protein SAMN02746068_01506 [Lactococcus chungangensis CAU 28 = DSM 22330]